VTASGVEAGAARVRSVWPRLARGGATGLLAVTVAFDETAMAWGQGKLLVAGQADVFLTYCTNAAQAVRELPSLRVVPLPAPLAVGADYGVTVLTAAHAERAGRLVSFILSPEGQAILTRHGFAAPTGPGG
jgi:ABC-type molybdate transport system substrate-binding protein